MSTNKLFKYLREKLFQGHELKELPTLDNKYLNAVKSNADNFTNSEIDRGLILIYASRNAHSFVNFTLPCADLKDFCSSPDRKEELILVLEVLAKKIRDDY